MKKIVLIGAVAVLGFGAVAIAQAVSLTILHNNDGESQLVNAGAELKNFGGAARFVGLINKLRANAKTDAVLTLSSGDNFLPGPEFNASLRNEVFYDAIALNAVGYDAIILGNHDFDFGPELLGDFIGGFGGPNPPPYLSANLDLSGEAKLQALVNRGRIAKSVIVEKAEESFGIIGATTPNLPFISSPGEVVVDQNVASVVQAEINHLEAQGVNKIILVSHLQGIREEIALIQQLKGVDIAIAGGGDELLANPGDVLLPDDVSNPDFPYPLFERGADGKSVPVVTTSGGYRYVGQLILEFDDAGDLTSVNPASGPVRVAAESVDGIPVDLAVQRQVVDPVKAFSNQLSNHVIAISDVPLSGVRNNIRAKETNLGNLITDAILTEARRLAQDFGVKPPDVALQNGGGIRNNAVVPVGNITELDTFDILPFPNFLSVFEDVSVARLKAIMENAVSRIHPNGGFAGGGTGRFAQIAGFKLIYDPSRQAIEIDVDGNVVKPGDRVLSMVLDDGTVLVQNGRVADPSRTIAIAIVDFLARGGDQYPFGGLDFTNMGLTYQQALFNYLATGLQGRITAAQYPVGGGGRIKLYP